MTIGIEYTEKRIFRKPETTARKLNRGDIIEFELPWKTEFYTLRTIQGYGILDEDTIRVTRKVHPDDRELAEEDLRAMGLSFLSPDTFLGPSAGMVILMRGDINKANLQIPQTKRGLSSRLIWWEEK